MYEADHDQIIRKKGKTKYLYLFDTRDNSVIVLLIIVCAKTGISM